MGHLFPADSHFQAPIWELFPCHMLQAVCSPSTVPLTLPPSPTQAGFSSAVTLTYWHARLPALPSFLGVVWKPPNQTNQKCSMGHCLWHPRKERGKALNASALLCWASGRAQIEPWKKKISLKPPCSKALGLVTKACSLAQSQNACSEEVHTSPQASPEQFPAARVANPSLLFQQRMAS